MSNAFVIIKICYVHNQWYDISCATLYLLDPIHVYFVSATINQISLGYFSSTSLYISLRLVFSSGAVYEYSTEDVRAPVQRNKGPNLYF